MPGTGGPGQDQSATFGKTGYSSQGGGGHEQEQNSTGTFFIFAGRIENENENFIFTFIFFLFDTSFESVSQKKQLFSWPFFSHFHFQVPFSFHAINENFFENFNFEKGVLLACKCSFSEQMLMIKYFLGASKYSIFGFP